MASDLFGSISSAPPSVRSRRPVVVVFTIAAHTIVFLAALFFSLAAPGLLPTPRTALAFFDEQRRVQLIDIDLPAPRRPPPQHLDARTTVPATPSRADLQNIAPLIAPPIIAPETDRDAAARARSSEITRLEAGTGNSLLEAGARRIDPVVAAAPQAPVRLHSGIQAPVKLVNLDPSYPALAQSARVQGVVILEAIIDVSGRVESVLVMRSIPMLDQAAIAAVRQWRYTPALLNGAPVSVIMTITVHFKL